ncbi:MAG: DUF1439 domain-containing protein [Rhodoferax sp.]|nr:DUF1439 domain-containing protein [Rhodoferax sp.]
MHSKLSIFHKAFRSFFLKFFALLRRLGCGLVPLRQGILALAGSALLLACSTHEPAGLFEIRFSQREVQAALDAARPTQALLDGRLTLGLRDRMEAVLGDPPGRIRLRAPLAITVTGLPPLPADVTGTASLRYDPARKAFFLDAPQVDSVVAPLLPRALEGVAREAITRLLASRLNQTPVYELRQDGPLKEQAARSLLQSVRIEPGQVVARFSLI